MNMIELDPTVPVKDVESIKARVREIIRRHNRGAWRIYGLDYCEGHVALLGATGEDSGALAIVKQDTPEFWRELDSDLDEWITDTDPYKEGEMEIVNNAFYRGGLRFSMING
jgi:hypothetical protein